MKSLILIFLIVGLIMITKSYMDNYNKCPLPKIEYRYVPRNFYEEQITENNLKNTYSDMFNKADTWSKYPNDISNVTVNNTSNFITESD